MCHPIMSKAEVFRIVTVKILVNVSDMVFQSYSLFRIKTFPCKEGFRMLQFLERILAMVEPLPVEDQSETSFRV